MKTVALQDVARFVRGVTFKPTDISAVGVGIMRTKNVQETLDLSDIIRVPARLVKRDEQYLRPGDILISSANSWYAVGRACWVPELPEPLAVGGFVTALRPSSEDIDPRYLYHWFSSPRAQAVLRSLSNKTTNISNLNLTLAAGMLVPMPSLEEQRRIAVILDHADALRTKRRQVVKQLNVVVFSMFRETFGRDAWHSVTPAPSEVNEYGWRWVPLGEVAQLATGHTPDRTREEYWSGSIPWISLPDIRALDGREAMETSLFVTAAGIAKSSAVILPPGTVCLSRTASVGFVTKMGRHMATSQDFHNWTPGPALNSDYLMTALRFSRSHLLGATDGSIHKTIYQRTAQTFRILLPPRYLQDQFATRLGTIRVQGAMAAGGQEADQRLFVSLQTRAFRGEL